MRVWFVAVLRPIDGYCSALLQEPLFRFLVILFFVLPRISLDTQPFGSMFLLLFVPGVMNFPSVPI